MHFVALLQHVIEAGMCLYLVAVATDLTFTGARYPCTCHHIRVGFVHNPCLRMGNTHRLDKLQIGANCGGAPRY